MGLLQPHDRYRGGDGQASARSARRRPVMDLVPHPRRRRRQRPSACCCASTSTCRWRTAGSPMRRASRRWRRPSRRSPTRAARSSCSRISAGPRAAIRRNRCKPIAAAAARIIGRPVGFAEDCIGDGRREGGRGDAGRATFCAWRTPASTKARRRTTRQFVAALAKLGDIWVNDAFSAAHRAHASTEGLGHVLPAYAGRAMQAELDALEQGAGPRRNARSPPSSAAPRSRPSSISSAISSPRSRR